MDGSRCAQIVRHVAEPFDDFRIPEIPVAGSPVRLNATTPIWPSLRAATLRLIRPFSVAIGRYARTCSLTQNSPAVRPRAIVLLGAADAAVVAHLRRLHDRRRGLAGTDAVNPFRCPAN